jgi:hypothetical protein
VFPLAKHLGVKRILANRLEFRNGLATGRLLDPVVPFRGVLSRLASLLGRKADGRLDSDKMSDLSDRPAPSQSLAGAIAPAERPTTPKVHAVVRFDSHPGIKSISVRNSLAGKQMLLVGATGFIGKVWLASLLRASTYLADQMCYYTPPMAHRSKKSKHLRLPKQKRLTLHIPLAVAGLQIFGIAISLCIFALLLPCSETFPTHLWRAVKATIALRGTTIVGIAWSILYPTLSRLYDAIIAFRQKGRLGMKDQIKKHRLVSSLAVVGAGWIILVIWNFIFMRPPSFSGAEIAEFSQGVVVNLGSTYFSEDTIGTGFWIDTKGYILTCFPKPVANPGVAELIPDLKGSLFIIAGAAIHARGEMVLFDTETGIEVVRVYENPFVRKLHAVWSTENTKTHRKEATTEKFWVPCLSSNLVNVGEPIFLAGIEPGVKGEPELSTVEGRVTRIGIDMNVNERFLRIYTNLPFKTSYRGAPVLDASKFVIGIVMDSAGGGGVEAGNAVLIPAKYAVDALTEAAPLMCPIQPTGPF